MPCAYPKTKKVPISVQVGTEAAFHAVEEYMKYVAEWFDQYELTKKVRLHSALLSTALQNENWPCKYFL